MVRRGMHKYITVRGYPPQLYDLKKDPEETLNVAGQASYRAIEKELHEIAELTWDAAALKNAVIRDQQERLSVRSMAPKWDFSGGPYLRMPGIRN